ncbi:MAG TPA: hypothetical protein VGM82_23760 [Gemmatimonadaceae bacterium]
MTAGRHLRDERLFVAVLNTALDTVRPDTVRIAALNVLAAYMKPSLSRVALDESATGPSLSYLSEIDTISSDRPIQGDVAKRVRDGFVRVAYGVSGQPSGARRSMWQPLTELSVPTKAGLYARDLLEALDEEAAIAAFPIAAPHVTVSYVCGNKFLLRNDTPFELALTYDVAGSGDMHEVRIPGATPGGKAVERTFTAPSAGSVRLFNIDEVIGTAPHRGTTC